MAEKYLHGYSTEEQERLVAQGQILAPFILERIDLQGIERLLEVGSGVGAMSLELLARYPDLRLTCLEIADTQLARARENLARANVLAQAELLQGDARQMPFGADAPFDAAFLCWILEHIPQPQAVLHELFRCLPLGATVFITEVFHSSFCLFPKCPNIEAYWRKAMEFQWNIGGDPDVGSNVKFCF
jgi:ubiquinone/menaquinone biosynthesis C-methylase UbiE